MGHIIIILSQKVTPKEHVYHVLIIMKEIVIHTVSTDVVVIMKYVVNFKIFNLERSTYFIYVITLEVRRVIICI